MGLLDGKVAIVTGAGGGLGRAHALALAREGAAVVVNDVGGARDGQGASSRMADEVVAEIRAAGGRAVSNFASVATEDGAASIARDAIEAFGRIDILVNNAGILRDKTFVKMDVDMWDAVVAVHLRGTFLVTRACVPHLLEVGGGSIINTSSLAGLKGNFGQSNYGAAKAGIWGFTNVLAMELGRKGIRCNCIAPIAKTRMTEDIDMVSSELAPEMVSPLVVFLASDLGREVQGRCFGAHGPEIIEYRMLTTPGARHATGHWTPAEIAAKLEEIGRLESERPATGASGGSAPTGPTVDEVFAKIGLAFRPEKAGGWRSNLLFDVRGTGEWTVRVAEGRVESTRGREGDPTCTITFASSEVFLGVVAGTEKADKAFMAGRIKASNMGDLMQFAQSFDLSAASTSRKAGGEAPAAPATPSAAEASARAFSTPATSTSGSRTTHRLPATFADPSSIAAYAEATGDGNARYRVGAEQVAPPLYAVRALHPLAQRIITDPTLELDVLRLVHGEQDMTFHHPIRPWDLMTPRGEVVSVEEKSSGRLVTCAQRLFVDGRLVADVRSGYFVRGERRGGEKGAPAAVAEAPGATLFEVRETIDAERPRLYAAASLDDNPIHVDDTIAQAAGFPGVILHGLCTMAILQKHVIDRLCAGEPGRLARLRVRFARPVFPGDTLVLSAFETSTPGEVALEVRKSTGEPALSQARAWLR